MKYILIFFIALTTACGEKMESSQSSKELFSSWSSGSAVLDLSGITFGVYAISIPTSSNTGCNCTIAIDGSQTTGTAQLYSCSHYGPVNYCSGGTTYYTYTNQNSTLTLCDGSTCEAYQ